MSRTYRTAVIDLDINDKPLHYRTRWWDEYSRRRIFTTSHQDYYRKRNKKLDKKLRYKPNKAFKILKRRIRRAKISNAMANHNYDNIPVFKNSDIWEWDFLFY